MTPPNDDVKAASPEISPSSSAGKPAPVDLEAGKARAGLRSGVPVNARRMDHVNMSVRDLDVSAAFYAALFGLEVKEQGYSGGRGGALSALRIASTFVSARCVPLSDLKRKASILITSDLSLMT